VKAAPTLKVGDTVITGSVISIEVTDPKRQQLWIPRRAPSWNDLLRAKQTLYGSKGANGYARLKKSWQETVILCVRQASLRPVSFCRLSFEFVEHRRNRDPDNLSAKFAIDGLVTAGILPGDGWKAIAGLSFSWRLGPVPGVLVGIEEVR
jgi:hypothetical protein